MPGYSNERHFTRECFVYPVSEDLSGSADALASVNVGGGKPIKVYNVGFILTTTVDSSADAVVEFNSSADVELATLNLPTTSAAGTTVLKSADFTTPAIFANGIVKFGIKTAATSAGAGYYYIWYSESYSATETAAVA